MKRLVEAMAPGLLVQPGLGTLTAAQILVSWSHPGPSRERSRIREPGWSRSDSGFVRPEGAPSPQPWRRPEVERALHTVDLSRCRYDQATRDYVARRSAEGKTQREIRRCLKRYLARQLIRFLSALDKG